MIPRFGFFTAGTRFFGELALVRGDEFIEAKQVAVALLPILRGFETWLKRKGASDPTFSFLFAYVGIVISEVEKWGG